MREQLCWQAVARETVCSGFWGSLTSSFGQEKFARGYRSLRHGLSRPMENLSIHQKFSGGSVWGLHNVLTAAEFSGSYSCSVWLAAITSINHFSGYRIIHSGFGTTPVGCRGGSGYAEGCWGFPYSKIEKFVGFIKFHFWSIWILIHDVWDFI